MTATRANGKCGRCECGRGSLEGKRIAYDTERRAIVGCEGCMPEIAKPKAELRKRKEPHPAEVFEAEQLARADLTYSLNFRRGPGFAIREDGFASLALADARALEIEAAHSDSARRCMIYAVTPEGRAILVPEATRIAARDCCAIIAIASRIMDEHDAALEQNDEPKALALGRIRDALFAAAEAANPKMNERSKP